MQLFFVSDIAQADYILETVLPPSLRTFSVLVAIPTSSSLLFFFSRYQSSARGVDESACLIDYKFVLHERRKNGLVYRVDVYITGVTLGSRNILSSDGCCTLKYLSRDVEVILFEDHNANLSSP